jgi:excisionase family DNA binding protein
VQAAKRYEDLPLTLKVEEMAEVLGVSRKVAYNLAKRRDFPAVRVGEKRLVIPRDRFLRWLNENADKPLD